MMQTLRQKLEHAESELDKNRIFAIRLYIGTSSLLKPHLQTVIKKFDLQNTLEIECTDLSKLELFLKSLEASPKPGNGGPTVVLLSVDHLPFEKLDAIVARFKEMAPTNCEYPILIMTAEDASKISAQTLAQSFTP